MNLEMLNAKRTMGLALAGLLVGASVAHSQTCSTQGIGAGTYYIASAVGDNRCVTANSDGSAATFELCNNGSIADSRRQFKLAPDPMAGSCYRFQSVSNGSYLTATIGGLPGDALLVITAAGDNASMDWRVNTIGTNLYTLIWGKDTAPDTCMNRRDMDDAGRVQAIHCTGTSNLERFWLLSTKKELDKFSHKKAKVR
jgi:hypothetical protein